MRFAQRRARALLLASVIAIAVATLTPRPDQSAASARTPFWCIVCGDFGAIDVLLNVVLFTPFGVALGLAGIRPLGTAALALGLSLSIELLQAVIPGRDPSASDLLTNTVGGALGGIVTIWARHLVRPTPRLAGLFAGAWAGLWLLQTGVTAAAVQPSLPRSWYWGQLAPELEQFEQFTGRVMEAWAGGYPIRIRRLETSSEIRDVLLAGEPLAGTTTPGTATPGVAPIVSIFDGQQREIVLLGRWDDDLVYRLRTRSFDFRLRPPTVRLPGAFTGGDTLLQVAGRFDPQGGSFVASLRSSSDSLVQIVPLDAQWGWSLLLPFPYAHGAESRWLTALWVTAWMVPLGYWTAGYRPAALGAAVLVLLLGLDLLPVVWGLRAAGLGGWLAGLAGLAGGAVAAPQPPSARSAASP